MSVETSVSTDGDNRIITIVISGPISKVDNLANDAAKEEYKIRWIKDDRFKTEVNNELIETNYEDLTKGQKLSILGLETEYLHKLMAKINYINNAIDSIKQTAEEEANDRY